MAYFEKVSGERVYLSPVTVDDAELFTSWLADTEIGIYTSHLCNVVSVEGEREFLQNNMCRSNNDFVIVVREGSRPIGVCSLMSVDYISGTAELGIMIGDKGFYGQGYGGEAINLLLDYGFRVRNLHSIYLHVYDFNKRAIACYNKCGFRESGRRREARHYGERYYDLLIMDKLASEHETNYLDEYLNT